MPGGLIYLEGLKEKMDATDPNNVNFDNFNELAEDDEGKSFELTASLVKFYGVLCQEGEAFDVFAKAGEQEIKGLSKKLKSEDPIVFLKKESTVLSERSAKITEAKKTTSRIRGEILDEKKRLEHLFNFFLECVREEFGISRSALITLRSNGIVVAEEPLPGDVSGLFEFFGGQTIPSFVG